MVNKYHFLAYAMLVSVVQRRSLACQQVPILSFFHHLGSGNGAPHSFTAMVQRQMTLPRVVVILAIRIVDVPRLDEEDKILINKLRSMEGFYVMKLRLGYRQDVDVSTLCEALCCG